ncbi:nucleotidyl transferase AbiEii/AbiGii toxin family protein [Chlorogloea sp. CCALA 695]|uniref:nucleotidyl transferase AbiEii/AbiGii toxin family protein n=1 Tax=Chlorogloea sp. CCALA 695 TaxID=2107693 RepID=UPI000D04B020|nr:nucleotidyl transferase AbiEii/AbiGii toxin family protein [Chlorogloea sp. CCALA 695]PSB29608.1 hypothetical protein C7B70_18135 [Chlorogloea sp. CCALA 695]
MKNILPVPPEDLDPLAAEILGGLRGQSDAKTLILGGYFALKHYLNYRQTKDIDAWWSQSSTPAERQAAINLLTKVLTQVAGQNSLELDERRSATTLSLELKRDGATIFSVQIADRDRELEPPIPSPYPPVQIETLRDNIGAKMNALVNRGAPRDFVDIYAIAQSGMATVPELWDCWQQKNPQLDLHSAKAQVLRFLNGIEQRRPIEQMPATERTRLTSVRGWFRQQLLSLPQQLPERGFER